MLSPSILLQIMPHCPADKAVTYASALDTAMVGAGIITVPRAANFLANIAHETCELQYMLEIADGSAYEGRKDLGNVKPGDGRRYKGRGPFQLTGRSNYRDAGLALGVDLEGTPELAAEPEIGFRVAAWFWTAGSWKHLSSAARQRLGAGPVNLNDVADRGDTMGCRMAINGGLNGYEQVVAYVARCTKVLTP